MQLMVIGLNHASANVTMREKFAVAAEQQDERLHQLVNVLSHQLEPSEAKKVSSKSDLSKTGAMILSTCNRTELVVDNEQSKNQVMTFLSDISGMSQDELLPYFYVHKERQAFVHLMKVASGMNSMVLGEPQIFGQMKSAYGYALRAGVMSSELDSVLQHVFSIAKKVRHETAIGSNPVSVAFAAINLAQKIFPDLSKANVLLVGAGETIELAGKHLQQAGAERLTIANRTIAKAQVVAEQFNAEYMRLVDLPERLFNFDILITSTASQLPIIGKGMVELALKQRKRKPFFIVDLAVPRDVEEQVGGLLDAYLYTLDDLQRIISENMQLRQQELSKAETIIESGVERFYHGLKEKSVTSLVIDYRKSIEDISEEELKRAQQSLEQGESPEKVLEQFSRSLTRKIMHKPSVEIKNAAAQGDSAVLIAASLLFGLDYSEQQNEFEESKD